MIEELKKQIDQLSYPERFITTREDELLRVKTVVYLYSSDGKVFAVTEDGAKHGVVQNLNSIQRVFPSYFLRVHRSFLVTLNRITGIFNRFPEEKPIGDIEVPEVPRTISPFDIDLGVEDECELALEGTEKRIPVTVTYAGRVKRAFKLKSLHHLIPEHPEDRKLRLLEIIDFGWRELYDLDPKNQAAVKEFKKKWDIREFPRERMLSYFRQVQVKRLDKKRLIKNILYQMHRWIKKGIEPLSNGNIRSTWYKIKTTLAQHSNALESGDVDTYYSTLQEMVEKENLFRYKDFGFMDIKEPFRKIGAKKPEIILATEKLGQFFFVRDLAAEVGVSFLCLGGEPAVISMEYFSDDLHQACGDKEKMLLCITDIDPAGYSIERNLVEGLKSRGHQFQKIVKLVDPSIFSADEITYAMYQVARYKQKGNTIKPMKPATMGPITKALNWLSEELKDDRFVTEKPLPDGWKIVTIWGIESDTASQMAIRKRFLKEVSPDSGRSRRKVPTRRTKKN